MNLRTLCLAVAVVLGLCGGGIGIILLFGWKPWIGFGAIVIMLFSLCVLVVYDAIEQSKE